jgi:hypothetical protein
LSDPIYSIGNQIDDLRDINVWRLYEIGRFSDSVNENGIFVGVDDGYGGLEPRFSCNVLINNEQEAFDAINSIATIFRGTTFYAGSDIDFFYDVEKDPIVTFNNQNVADGAFNYSDSLKSSRYTVVEVPYVDKRDNFLQKVEYYEDEEGIRQLGYIKHTFQGIGTTSRGQAQRFAKYAALTNKLETETVSFVGGNEALFVQPGDVIRIDDEIKNIAASYGYVADIDYSQGVLVIPDMDTGQFDTGIYLYCETGENAIGSLFQKAYETDQAITNQEITDINTSKIELFEVASYDSTGDSIGGSGIRIGINTGIGGTGRLNNVPVGSLFSIKTTGRNDHLYKVIAMTESAPMQYELTAAQYVPEKFDWVESGIKFDRTEEYFENLTVDFSSNAPDPPIGVGFDWYVDNGLHITGHITGNTTFPTTDQYQCVLSLPYGRKISQTVSYDGTNTDVLFGYLGEIGEYKMNVWAIGEEPLALRSTNSQQDNLNIPIGTSLAQDVINVKNMSTTNSEGGFAPSIISSGTGNFEQYDWDVTVSWELQDRLELPITKPADYDHWDNPTVSVDILDDGHNVQHQNYIKNAKTNSLYLDHEDISGIFDEYPREFQVQLRVTGIGQSVENTGIITVTNPLPSFTNWKSQSVYDSLLNRFKVVADAPYKVKKDIQYINWYTGSVTGFAIEDTNLFYRQAITDVENRKPKKVRLAREAYYPIISNDKFFSLDSIKDHLFKQGDFVKLETQEESPTYPSGLDGDTVYEMILGKTIDSIFYFDADDGYVTGGPFSYSASEKSGIRSQHYVPYSEALYTGMYALNRIQPGLDYDHTGGGTGLLQGARYLSDNAYLTISDPAGTRALGGLSELALKLDIDKNEKSRYYGMSPIRLAVATDSTILEPYHHMQEHRNSFTFTTWLKPTMQYDANGDGIFATGGIFDFSNPTGGSVMSFIQDGQVGGNYNSGYRLDIQLLDGAGGGLADTLTLIGDNLWVTGQWMHLGVILETYDTFNESGVSGYASIYKDGEIVDSGWASGSGMNEHHGACGIGGIFGQSLNCESDTKATGALGASGFAGNMTDIACFHKAFSSGEMALAHRGLRNQFMCQLSTGGHLITASSGENVETYLHIESTEARVIDAQINTYLGTEERLTLRDKINAGPQFTGIRKQFTINKNENDDIIGTQLTAGSFYLTEINFAKDDFTWANIINPDFKMKYVSGARSGIQIINDPAVSDGSGRLWETGNDQGTFTFDTDHYKVETETKFFSPLNSSTNKNRQGLRLKDGHEYNFSVQIKDGSDLSVPVDMVRTQSNGSAGSSVLKSTTTTASWVTWDGTFVADLTLNPTRDCFGFYVDADIGGDIQMRNFILNTSGDPSSDDGHPAGRWVLYSGDTSNDFYHYTGANDGTRGAIPIEGDTIASGYVPIQETFKTGYFGRISDLSKTSLPSISQKVPVNISVDFSDFYLRGVPEDYIGTGQSFPDLQMPPIGIQYAMSKILSDASKVNSSLLVGEQLHAMIKSSQEKFTDAESFQDFVDAVNADPIYEDNLTPEPEPEIDMTPSVSPKGRTWSVPSYQDSFTTTLTLSCADTLATIEYQLYNNGVWVTAGKTGSTVQITLSVDSHVSIQVRARRGSVISEVVTETYGLNQETKIGGADVPIIETPP